MGNKYFIKPHPEKYGFIADHKHQLIFIWDDEEQKEFVVIYQEKQLKKLSKVKRLDPKDQIDKNALALEKVIEQLRNKL